MSSLKVNKMQKQIDTLTSELEVQKGMIWVIGEIMKNAANLTSYRELMKIITDMLMGVMGVCSCYIWINNKNKKYTLHYRSIASKNIYHEKTTDNLPVFFKNLEGAQAFLDFKIKTSLLDDGILPGSRLSVPLYDFQKDAPIGFLVVEHKSQDFFTESTILLLETLAIFIGSHSRNSKIFELVDRETRHDPLTKIFNRKFLDQFFEDFKHNDKPLSLCIFDVDFFKRINDLYGHEKGDKVLVEISKATSDILKEHHGKVIRYGGDEFIILLELSIEEALPVLEKLRKLIPVLPVMKTLDFPVTVTMGVSSYPLHTNNIYQLIPLADSGLLTGKSLGRNILQIGQAQHLY